MVLSRNDKRKRKEGDLVDLMDPLAESQKRTKIHAQRKFAQGVATPVYSPASTPIKEKEKAKPTVFTELITHKRPNTEDFLTFLCFRGTSMLPPNLNFFSNSSKKDKSQDASKQSATSNHYSKANGTCGKPMAPSKAESQTSNISSQKSVSIKEKTANVPKKQVPVPKTLKLKTTSTAIQALKKKYQEQRLAKQRLKKFKPSCMKTRSNATNIDQTPIEKPVVPKVAAPRKMLSRIESRRHGLRSTGLPESEKKSLPLKSLKKELAAKPKKKIVPAKDDASSVDSFVLKSSTTVKKSTAKIPTQGKLMKKKLLEKSKKKFEAKRVTRSRMETPPPPPVARSPTPVTNPVRRPTRKTKEAAALYMEILGRKLVSPDLENDDNMSLDSFPELPNARKLAQTENEIKAKVKSQKVAASTSLSSVAAKDKEKKTTGSASTTTKPVKKKVIKPVLPLKNKRLVKVQKYYEHSDEESISSKEMNEAPKKPSSPMTRRSAPTTTVKDKKLENRNLRSSRSLASRKSLVNVNDTQSSPINESTSTKSAKNIENQNVSKPAKETTKETTKDMPKEKTVGKRKRESNVNEKEKESPAKRLDVSKNKSKSVDTPEVESEEEESLGSLLDKLKKKKESEKEEINVEAPTKKTTETKSSTKASAATTTTISSKAVTTSATEPVKATETVTITTTATATTTTTTTAKTAATLTTKVSDDEESFRGFTKKSIIKVANTCQSHVKANNLLEDVDSKINVLMTHEILANASVGLKDIKKDIKSSVLTCMKLIPDQLMGESGTTSTAANASVKLEPDFGELKVSSATTSLNIIDMPKSLSHHGRKERVNMSTEQIEKWLNESSLAKEESKVEMESVSSFKYDTTPRAIEKSKSEQSLLVPTTPSHLSISPKIQHLVRPVNVTLSKLSDRLKRSSMTLSSATGRTTFGQVTSSVRNQLPIATKAVRPPVVVESAKDKKEVTPSTPPSRKMSKDSSVGEDAAESDAVSKSDANSVSDSLDKKSMSSPEKKVFFHQRKPFLPKFKERKPSSSAFSPENESSVYAFESEAEAPVNTPFRRKAKEQPSAKDSPEKDKSAGAQPANSETKNKNGEETKKMTEPLNSPEEAQKDEEKSPPLLERTTPKNFELPKNFADLTNIQVLPLDKLTTSWSNVSCSASIAVQVNLDDQKQQQSKQQGETSTTAESNGESSANQRSTEISTQTDSNADNDDDDSSGQLFYIPLQAVTRNASAQGGQQLIQGVAVKLGTEGPTGPNQRVLLKAKLVTKPPISVARCPPIGTVQPTARTPQNTSSSADQVDLPSTSSIETEDEGFKFQVPAEKGSKTTTTGSKQIRKTPEKVIKSPKAKEKKTSAEVSGKGSKKSKSKHSDIYLPVNNTTFPKTKDANDKARLVEAPTFRPSAQDFKDPLEYIDKIRPIAEKFGICKVVPPSYFKPECKVSDDMRFTAYNHYVHRMLHRWGPNVKEMMAMKKYLATQSISLTQPPFIGGMEVDLPHLYQTVQNLGGLKEVIEKKKWQKVADGMKIPRSAQDRVTKLDDIYCKYLLPYDTLSQEERDKLFKDVEADWVKREKRDRQETQSNDTEDEDDDDSSEEIEECIVKGRNMPLNAFYRIARNTQRMWFGENTNQQQPTSEMEGASADEVETAFWKHVVEKKRHVCVHAASIDSSGHGFGFSVTKNSPFARHPWNLKILTNNAGSVLRALGPQMGVTVPTLHVGMLFSACCWYRDPHGLPWIEYLHTGAKKIWYGIPDEQNNAFRKALTKMFPRYCKNKTIWLPSDTAMVPPDMLVSNDVPLCQTVQEPGQFIVVFPKAFTSSICTGYVVSESVYFAQPSWLETAEQVFQDIHDSCEPSIFSFERLLFSIINDFRSHIDVLKQILPTVIKVCDKEIENRKKLKDLGLTNTEKLPLPSNDKKGKGKKVKKEEIDYECDICRANLFVSLVSNSSDGSIFCLIHAIQHIEKKKQNLKNYTLMYTYSESELNDLIHKLKDRIEAKSKKTNQTKQAK